MNRDDFEENSLGDEGDSLCRPETAATKSDVNRTDSMGSMRNRGDWKPSKFVYRRGHLRASLDNAEVSISSRLVVDLVAGLYEKLMPGYARGRLLDLGCGKVPLLSLYEHSVQAVTCVDWEHSLHSNQFVDCECDLSEDLPFEDGEFDTVLLSDVLEHIPNPGHLVSEIARVLSVGGTVILNVPFYYSVHEAPYDYFRYTEFALRMLMKHAGLTERVLLPIGGIPEIMGDLVAKSLVRVPVCGRICARVVQWIVLHFVRTRLGRKLSVATSTAFPLGYFVVAEHQA